MNLVGKQLGKYQIRAELGAGGMGVVYRAFNPDLNVEVAIKVLQPQAAGEERALARFRREMRILAKLQHPHLIPIFDCDLCDGTPYYVMPLVTFPTLAADLERVEERGQGYPLERALGLTRGLLEVLRVVHEQGIVHRDLKPANIFVEPGGRPLLADFGLARGKDDASLTRSNSMIGTVLWMAPEQLDRQHADARTDLYGLGLVLYRMLAGQLPYKEGLADCIKAKCFSPALPAPTTRDGRPLSDRVTGFLSKLTAHDPGARHQSAEEALKALDELRSGREPPRPASSTRATANPPPAAPEPEPPPAQTRPAMQASPAARKVSGVAPAARLHGPERSMGPLAAAFATGVFLSGSVAALLALWLPLPAGPILPAGTVVPPVSAAVTPAAPAEPVLAAVTPPASAPEPQSIRDLPRTWPGAKPSSRRDTLARLLAPEAGRPGSEGWVDKALNELFGGLSATSRRQLVVFNQLAPAMGLTIEQMQSGRPLTAEARQAFLQFLRMLDEAAVSSMSDIRVMRSTSLPPLHDGRAYGNDLQGLMTLLELLYPGFHKAEGFQVQLQVMKLRVSEEEWMGSMLEGSNVFDPAVGKFLASPPPLPSGAAARR